MSIGFRLGASLLAIIAAQETLNPVLVKYASAISGLAGNVSDINATSQGSGWTDDTTVLQNWINSSDARTKTLVMDRACLITGLVLPSNTTIVTNAGCGFYLATGSNKHALRNANPKRIEAARHWTTAEQAAMDHDISITGAGVINANQSGQSWKINGVSSGNGEFTSGIAMFGVKNCVVDTFVIYPRCFSIWFTAIYGTWRMVNRGEKILLDGNGSGVATGPENIPLYQDGCHINGPMGGTGYIEFNGQSWDDAVGLNADDGNGDLLATNEFGPNVGRGPIDQGVVIKGRTNKSLFGLRLLSKTSLIDNLTIDFAGTTIGRGLVVAPYQTGIGNWGSNIHFTNFDVAFQTNNLVPSFAANEPLAYFEGVFAGPVVFDKFRSYAVDTSNSKGRLIEVKKSSTVMPLLDIASMDINDIAGQTFAPADGVADKVRLGSATVGLRIRKLRWSRDASLSSGLGFVALFNDSGGTDNAGTYTVEINDVITNNAVNIFSWVAGTLNSFKAQSWLTGVTNSIYVSNSVSNNCTTGYISSVSNSPAVNDPNNHLRVTVS